MRCERCGQQFREELDFVKKKRNYTKRFVKEIIQEVIESDIRNVAQRNQISEQEVETILKDAVKNKIKLIKRCGYGFRNFDNFSSRCFLTWFFPISFTS
ncbi:MAG: helix-turn-helix domain-containing protein [Cyanobacteria bacterium P01_G01_bin.39]